MTCVWCYFLRTTRTLAILYKRSKPSNSKYSSLCSRFTLENRTIHPTEKSTNNVLFPSMTGAKKLRKFFSWTNICHVYPQTNLYSSFFKFSYKLVQTLTGNFYIFGIKSKRTQILSSRYILIRSIRSLFLGNKASRGFLFNLGKRLSRSFRKMISSFKNNETFLWLMHFNFTIVFTEWRFPVKVWKETTFKKRSTSLPDIDWVQYFCIVLSFLNCARLVMNGLKQREQGVSSKNDFECYLKHSM